MISFTSYIRAPLSEWPDYIQKGKGKRWAERNSDNLVDTPIEFTHWIKTDWNFNISYEGYPFSVENYVVKLNGVLAQDMPRTPGT